ncbi:MAG: thiol:disulfide interchange protein DsbA/DsbL [Inhella sp.]|jgi:thiol:disulfide interchange protein DsbA|uniref:thiol:disulfide interchange protein DsbA/DsbL n=1 Tax=Inhella sp. TaxID=1921806 RepID=UPI0022C156E5|nr:thiol:disulfide interchange protein DsbA/DsbL [Inhella sp.]MCZ8234060.1 thiol:disulfide interchange protein DsbA/DsbL [Inhella sp.]
MIRLNRRQAALATATTLAGLGPVAQAQTFTPQEGRHYRRLPKRLAATPGKVEVIEFFLYTCPICFEFETQIKAWLPTLPPHVEFKPMHVLFQAVTRHYQRLFFTLDAMGLESKYRSTIFNAIHRAGNPLDTPDAVIKLLGPLGLDGEKFKATFNAFGVGSRINAANQLANAYGIDGVPTLGIGGLYLTSPEMARNQERLPREVSGQRAVAIANQLIASLKG